MKFDQLKKNAAFSVLDYISYNSIIGIGSGSTVLYFIKALSNIKKNIFGVVSSSNDTTIILKKYGIKVFDLNTIPSLMIYIDSADEINYDMQMIKGGGAALTKEKILASSARQFICIIDKSKKVNILGSFPLPLEVIPFSYSYICQEIIKLGGIPKYRKGVVTDNGNIIIDVHNLNLNNPVMIEKYINSLSGVVTVGLFASRTADVALIGTYSGIKLMN
ncbi:ribose-5-phosphate isomerase RpiA [Buchnera aphidicola]|uniref:ribose-5-phosphate isomerase RpiA n=1 Tax=Buchnera aphidicola TaxID=9 RepID=UPI00346472C8